MTNPTTDDPRTAASRVSGSVLRRQLGRLLVAVALAAGLTASGVAAVGPTSGAGADTSGAPGTPLNPAAVPSLTSTNVTVSWTPAPGPVATAFTVAAFNTAGSVVAYATCAAGCTSTVAPGLTAGSAYAFAIWASNAAGGSQAAGTPYVTVNSGCSSSLYCVGADATSTAGPVTHNADGLLHSDWTNNTSLAQPLGVNAWRIAILPSSPTQLNYAEYDNAVAAGATTITDMVSDAWFYASSGGCGGLSTSCGATPPWQELATYSAWVTNYVRQIEASGRHPTYWDIQNEPDAAVQPGSYFTTSDAATVTPDNVMAEFEAGYNAIKAADPAAKVEGPSLSEVSFSPDPHLLDMNTFLSYSATHNLHWDVISWHENGGNVFPQAWDILPTVKIATDVAAMRSLLAQYPSLGTPALAINEFGMPYTQTDPGWYASYLASIEASGVATANRTCFNTLTDNTQTMCEPGNLDNLLTSAQTPSAGYQVLLAYSQLTGQRIATTPSDATLSALGAIDASGTVRLLIGRAYTCAAAVNPDCNQPAYWTPPPADVPVTLKVPWTGSATLTVARIPDVPGQTVSAPTTVSSSTVTVSGGSVSVTLPQVADGEAWTVTLSPTASSSGGTAAAGTTASQPIRHK